MTAFDEKLCLVVPCYNEESRLDVQKFLMFLNEFSDVDLIFVNDGSRDRTLDVLNHLKSNSNRIQVLSLNVNSGKAEAVRQGTLAAFNLKYKYIGFWDADLATPLSEVKGFMQTLDEKPEVHLVIGARVRLLGRKILRSWNRHYLGRVFGTFASVALNLAIYDTQCGAKIFRATETVHKVFNMPFHSRWIFDVEMIARLGASGLPKSSIYEWPVQEWSDVKGSKVGAKAFLNAGFELVYLWFTYRPKW
ncbi:MAG: glycosyltransferase [Proteobacteria bacterium]|nr:glycosyltransferase [Pseudomonadota bacterium]